MQVPALRGFCFGAFATLALIFTIAALSTKLGSAGGDGTFEVDVTLWQYCARAVNRFGDRSARTCVSTTSSNFDCSSFKSRFRAAQAFYVLTLMMLLPCIAMGAIDHFRPEWLLKVPKVPPRLLMMISAAIVIFLSLIAWATALSIPRSEFCGGSSLSDADSFDWGASPFLMLIVWIFAIIMLFIAIFLPPRSRHETFRSAAQATHPAAVDTDSLFGRDNTTNPKAAPVGNEPVPAAMGAQAPYDVNANRTAGNYPMA